MDRTNYNEVKLLADKYYQEAREILGDNKIVEAGLLAQNALHLYKLTGCTKEYIKCLNMLGVIFSTSGYRSKALECYLEALSFALSEEVKDLLANIYNNIGSQYQDTDDHKLAVEYFLNAKKALGYSKGEINYNSLQLAVYFNLAKSYVELNELELSRKNLDIVRSLLENTKEDFYRYGYRLIDAIWLWKNGEKDLVIKEVDSVLKSDNIDINNVNFAQELREASNLLKDMKEYDRWKMALEKLDEYVKAEGNLYFELLIAERWLDYYNTINDTDNIEKIREKCSDLRKRYEEIAARNISDYNSINEVLRSNEKKLAEKYKGDDVDELTGLKLFDKNRNECEKIMTSCAELNLVLGIGMIDIDGFFNYNDEYGHSVGDECLAAVGRCLENCVKGKGSVYRIKNDEFIVLVPGGKTSMLKDMGDEIQRKVHENEYATSLKMSQGYVSFTRVKELSISEILMRSTMALEYVKENGGNSIYVKEK